MTLDNALARLGECRGIVVACDFDGTLAPIVDRPERALVEPLAIELLIGLAARDEVVAAVISGRRHAELASLLGDVPGVVLIGEHGNDRGELGVAGETVDEMAGFIRGVGEALPGSAVEVKRHGVGFHYRLADEMAAEEAVGSILSWAEERPEIKVTRGKKLVEMSVAPHHKGDAVLALKDEAGADCVVFIGDDTTDENVFEVLGPSDIGIKVGPGETAARYRVADVAEVVRVIGSIESVLG